MLIYNLHEYPKVTLTFTSTSWDRDEYDGLMDDLSSIMDQAIQRGERIQLLICGNPDLSGSKPSIQVCMWFIRDILRLFSKLKTSIERTAIWTPTTEMDYFFEMLFTMYTPSRPLKLFTEYDEAVRWVSSDDV
jgi:hypothetical protein